MDTKQWPLVLQDWIVREAWLNMQQKLSMHSIMFLHHTDFTVSR